MYQYRQVIHRMRIGETDRAIARSKLMGRLKCAQLRAVADKNGWLNDTPLPDDQALHDLNLVAVHPRLQKPGLKSTVDEHQPPEALAFKMQDPQWCLKQAKAVGSHCHQFICDLFADRVLDNLRVAQGVIGLGKKYGPARLEAACRRALFFENPKYRTVKSILSQDLDQLPLEKDKVLLSSIYTCLARFMRTPAELQVN